MKLGELLKKYRKENNMTMQMVADLCGITKGYVAMLERGTNTNGKEIKPSIETIIKICNGLHWDVDETFNMLDDNMDIHITNDTLYITPETQFIVESYQKLDADKQKQLESYLSFLLHEENK